MSKETIYLDGLVLRSLDINKTSNFYQSLLQIDFKLEQHNGGEPHYAGRDNGRFLFEIYPSKRAVTPPSPYLTFRVIHKNLIHERILDYIERMKQTGENQWEFVDPDDRKITIFQDDDADDYITLHSVGLHCYSPDSAKKFYEHLLHIEAKERKDDLGKTYYNFSLPKVKLELHHTSKTVVPASPKLLFHTSNLDYFAEKFSGQIKERKEFPHLKEVTLYDNDGRKLFVYQIIPEPSWLDRFRQYFVAKRQQ